MLDDIDPALLLDQIGAAPAIPLAIKGLNHRFLYVNTPFCDAVGQRRSLVKAICTLDDHARWYQEIPSPAGPVYGRSTISLLQAADHAMHQAKRNGKRCVCV